ncbi:MAG: DNA-protecting protein DprA, partial [Chloroflexi bacterium]|nr:DNA-protecting protein DprA [Chloroflexota bacterium]
MGDDLRYWVGFNRISGEGAARSTLLLEAFGDLESAWKATAAELREAGLGQKTIQSILSTRDEMDLDRELERIY